ncbi:lactate 2-monooxygenase [Catellatospora citrea]|uniref:Lactate 2-monooxygenase n=1 Tax=Catellatospora citrea TaxID=53366 RepID=A0A8J3P425_9ACTN|nr:lactate 2-monooxygenase [Catellatospora citrea]RKE06533.1 lactate 2-monooxygenase [Catellatospora citrea]GIG02929.1 lactate 2-monooxygenase [Catellatospora citrea]
MSDTGHLPPADDTDPAVRAAGGWGRLRQGVIYRDGVSGVRPAVPTAFPELERRAARVLSAKAYAYVAGSAGLEGTADANRRALDRHRIVPRMLRDVSARDLSVELFGRRLASPLLLAPIGVLELAHPEADVAVARAAAAEGVPYILSTQASRPMEQCAAAMGDAPRWFQLYWSKSEELVASFLARAEAAGCEALVVTLDTTVLGWRARDLDLGSLPFSQGQGIAQYTSDPVFRRLAAERAGLPKTGPKPKVTPAAVRSLFSIARTHPGPMLRNLRSPLPRAAVETFLDIFSRQDLTWGDLARLRSMTRLPILLKGLQHADDARRALDAGVDGVIVSNHGGRQVDGATGSLDALPGIVEAVGGRVPVLFDSGVRGGADVFKALALGARAVCVGRPYFYGLALAGADGVRQVIQNLRAELDLTMALTGCASLADLTPDLLAPA